MSFSDMRDGYFGDKFYRCHGPFASGFIYKGHRHWVDHYSVVPEGTSLVVRYRHAKDGPIQKETQYDGPCRILIAAGIFHEIQVISDGGRWECEFDVPDQSAAHASVFNLELD